MPFSVDAAVRWLADGLLTASWQGAVVIAIVWLACRHLTRIPARVQATLWWLAALKLVLALLPVPAMSLPVLPAAEIDAAARAIAAPVAAPSTAASVTAAPSFVSNWVTVVVALWALGVLAQAIRLLAAFRDLRGIVGRSTPLADDDAALVSPFARALGLTRVPAVRVSDEIEAPMVSGLRRPIVLVPAGTQLGSEDLRMALCHELMHIRRHDLALGWMPAIAERLFFFHPLARVAAREYVTAREAACDAAVVAALGVSPDQYGRLLIRLGIARSEPALAAGGAPASMSSLRRRLDMLKHSGMAGASRRWTWSLVALAILTLAPFHLSAKTAPSQTPTPRAARPELQSAPARPAPQAAPVPREQGAQKPESVPAVRRPQPSTEDELRANLERLVRETEANYEQLLREAEAGDRAARLARQAVPETVRTEEFLRAQVAALSAQLEKMAEYELRSRESPIEQRYRQSLLDAEKAFEAQRTAEARVRDNSDSLTVQLEVLRQQQETLMRQMEQIAEQQKALAEMQRRMATETERLREALKTR